MSIYLTGLIISIVFYAMCFIATNNYFISLIPSLICIVFFFMIAPYQLNKYSNKVKMFRFSNQFVNNFIIALSIQPVIDNAYEISINTLDSKFKEKIKGAKDLNGKEKIKYLGNYFSFNVYRIFIQIVELWEEQGGDILNMSNFLVNQYREIEEYIANCEHMQKRKTIEFSILWLFALSIIVVLRYALSQFYQIIVGKLFYQIGIVSIFLFAIFSFQILISKITQIDIQGGEINGKFI